MKHRFIYIYSAFTLSLFILVILAFLFLQQFSSMKESNSAVEESLRLVYRIRILESSINEIEASSRTYVLTRNDFYLNHINQQKKEIKNAIDSLRDLITVNDRYRSELFNIQFAIQQRLIILNENINKVLYKDTTGLNANLVKGTYTMDTLQRQLRQLEKGELEILRGHSNKKRIYENITPNYFKMMLVFTTFITLGSFFFINKELRKRLRYQKELEEKVNALHNSNNELQQIANVASHDLQEPLRKIRTFISRLLVKYSGSVNDDVKLMLKRIDASATRMHELINDVVNFTNLINSAEKASIVELGFILETVQQAFAKEITAKNVIIHQDRMPVVYGYSHQLSLLFRSLFDNSLKFTHQGVRPRINIRFNNVQEMNNRDFYHIIVEDNGIGFDNDFGEKIFMIFQRLHSDQAGYKGKGIGLAIVKRVMANHNGLVSAEGRPGRGSTFNLYFPVPSL